MVMLKTALTLLLLLVAGPALAVIDLSPKLIEVPGEGDIQVQITNKGDHAEYVSISLSRLLNPGVPYEEEKLEPVGLSRNPQLYAYPFRLSLSRGQSKLITLKPLAAVAQETVYRLAVKPVTALSGEERNNPAGGVAVNLSFSALVRQLPQKQTSTISTSCATNSITLTATGTTRYEVKKLAIDGVMLDDFNVYPGIPRVIAGREIKADGKVLCSRR